MAVLLAPRPRTSTSELLARAAARRGLGVAASARPGQGIRPGEDVHWYGGPLAAARITPALGVGLLEPRDDWLTGLPYELVARRIRLTTLAAARRLESPAFVKPPSDKSVPAAVYPSGRALPGDDGRIGPATPVLVSEVVGFTDEYRLWILDGAVRTGSRYAVHGRLDPGPLTGEAREFARRLLTLAGPTLPSAVVVDIGRLRPAEGAPPRAPGGGEPGREWAVVEANMPWFAQCYAAEPELALDVVLRAAGPRRLITSRDAPFLRMNTEENP
ncbi:ATP-grasp domain-containing protein [Streptomyces sp. CAU 1734]|uniref:ATP-grasp domain-containing protein n=1 Tax=Streptomyces sp. CAU 1734 TaxID=3140360 RepID=UPI0032603FFB